MVRKTIGEEEGECVGKCNHTPLLGPGLGCPGESQKPPDSHAFRWNYLRRGTKKFRPPSLGAEQCWAGGIERCPEGAQEWDLEEWVAHGMSPATQAPVSGLARALVRSPCPSLPSQRTCSLPRWRATLDQRLLNCMARTKTWDVFHGNCAFLKEANTRTLVFRLLHLEIHSEACSLKCNKSVIEKKSV